MSQQPLPLGSEFKKNFNYSLVWMVLQSLSEISTFKKKKTKIELMETKLHHTPSKAFPKKRESKFQQLKIKHI